MVVTARLALLASANRHAASGPRTSTSTAGRSRAPGPRLSASHAANRSITDDDVEHVRHVRAVVDESPVLGWSPSMVSEWLREACNDELAQAALDAGVDGATLAHLDGDAWAELGVGSRVEQARVVGKVKAVCATTLATKMKEVTTGTTSGDENRQNADGDGGGAGNDNGVFKSKSDLSGGRCPPTCWDSSTGRGGVDGVEDDQHSPTPSSVVVGEGPTLKTRFGYLAWVGMFVPWLMLTKNWIGGAEHRSYWHQSIAAANATNGAALKDHYLRFLGMYNVIDILTFSISVEAVFSSSQPVSLLDVTCLMLLGLSATCAGWSTAVSTISYNAISAVHENNFSLFAKSTASRRMMMFVNDMSIASLIFVVSALCTTLGRFASGLGKLSYGDAEKNVATADVVDTSTTTITRWLYLVPIINVILLPISFEHIVMCTNTVLFGGLMSRKPVAPTSRDRAMVGGGGGGGGGGGAGERTQGGGGGAKQEYQDEDATRAADIADLGGEGGEVDSGEKWLVLASEKEVTHFLCDNIYRSLQVPEFYRAVVRRYANVAKTEIEDREVQFAATAGTSLRDMNVDVDDEDDVIGATKLVGALMKMASRHNGGRLPAAAGDMWKGDTATIANVRSKRRISPL